MTLKKANGTLVYLFIHIHLAGAKRMKVDLMVIGAGSGGVRAARIAASHGAKD